MVIQRSGHKGQFIKYPGHWQKQMPSSLGRRWQTYCDMVIGKCSCGRRHTESDFIAFLDSYGDRYETRKEWRVRCLK